MYKIGLSWGRDIKIGLLKSMDFEFPGFQIPKILHGCGSGRVRDDSTDQKLSKR
jgi:hypothetical protein